MSQERVKVGMCNFHAASQGGMKTFYSVVCPCLHVFNNPMLSILCLSRIFMSRIFHRLQLCAVVFPFLAVRDPAPSSPNGHSPPPNFWPMSVVTKRLFGSRCHLVRRYRPRPRPHIVLDGDPPPQKKGTKPPPNFPPMSVVAKRLD